MIHRQAGRISAILGWILLGAASVGDLGAQGAAPPTAPPAEWGPVSINLEEIEYPYQVQHMNLRVHGQDVRMAYMDVPPAGVPNGRTVILLHGGSYYGWYWKAQIKALTEAGFRVVVEDRLGWGKSSKPILPYSMSLHAGNTAALLDHLGIASVALVGHSMGGQIVSRFAFLYPERTTHMVMVNPIGLTDNRAGGGVPARQLGGGHRARPPGRLRGGGANRSESLCSVEARIP